MPTDSELLRQYAERGDEAAFAEVVRRQMDFVYSVALRVARDGHLAEDVTQKVFLKLAREAEKLCVYDTLVGWLHLAARHAAIDSIRGEERRRAREQEAFIMQNDSSAPGPNWEQLQPVLDEAVEALPEDDRKAVLLRYFKNQSHQEIGAVLGLSEDTARKRGERALEKLRGHFVSRGVTASSALLAAAISANSVRAAPAGLAERVTPAAVAKTGASAGAMAIFLLMSTKSKISLAVAILLIIAALMMLPRHVPAEPAMTPKPPVPAVAAVSTPAPRPAAEPVPAAAPPAPVAAEAPRAAVENPQAEIATAIPEFLRVAEAKDLVGIMRFMLSPQEIQADLRRQGMTTESALAESLFQQQKDPAGQMEDLAQVARALQNVTPVIDSADDRATFELSPPVGKHSRVLFIKKEGLWILRSS